MVVNHIAERQYTITSALELPRTWARKVDYYNLGVNIANVKLPMHDLNGRMLAKFFFLYIDPSAGHLELARRNSTWSSLFVVKF